jgi:hypothetical protein
MGLIVGLRGQYEITSNRESGNGRYDMAFVPKNPNNKGIILEFKSCKDNQNMEASAQEALTQIQNKQYPTLFKNRQTQGVLCIGMAFYKKEMEAVYTILKTS